jgi:hypothetical protein
MSDTGAVNTQSADERRLRCTRRCCGQRDEKLAVGIAAAQPLSAPRAAAVAAVRLETAVRMAVAAVAAAVRAEAL